MRPVWRKPGAILLQRHVPCSILRQKAVNHDPQHEPYGIRWQPGRRLATKQAATAYWRPGATYQPSPSSASAASSSQSVLTPTLHASQLQDVGPATEQPAPAPEQPSPPPTPAAEQPAPSTSASPEQPAPSSPASTLQISQLQDVWPATEQPAPAPERAPPPTPAAEQPAPSTSASTEKPAPSNASTASSSVKDRTEAAVEEKLAKGEKSEASASKETTAKEEEKKNDEAKETDSDSTRRACYRAAHQTGPGSRICHRECVPQFANSGQCQSGGCHQGDHQR